MSETEAAATAPGRAAYDGFNSVMVWDTRWPRWELLSETQQRAWAAAARAGAANLAGLMATAQRLRDEAMDEARALRAERDTLTGRVAELEGLLAEAAAPTAGYYGNAAEILRLREQLAGERAGRLRSTGERDEARAERDWLRRELAKAQDEIAEHLRTIRSIGDCRERDASTGPDGGGGRDGAADHG